MYLTGIIMTFRFTPTKVVPGFHFKLQGVHALTERNGFRDSGIPSGREW